jgi:hypothetical protein
MALLAALTLFVHATCGFRHRDVRTYVADLLGIDYSANQLSYDLRRLRRKGIIWRIPDSHRYRLTPYGSKVALFFTRLHLRLFAPGFAALDPTLPIPSPLAQALTAVDEQIDLLINEAHLAPV